MSNAREHNSNEFNLIDLVTTKRNKGKLIWLFNIGTEKFWKSKEYTLKDKNEEIVVNHIEDINMLLTRKQDTLIMRDEPDKKFLEDLVKLGFEIPHIISLGKKDNAELPISQLLLNNKEVLDYFMNSNDIDTLFVPYGISYLEDEISLITGVKRSGPSVDVIKLINDKMFARNLAIKNGMNVTEGFDCFTLDDIRDKYYELNKKYNKIIIKQCFGASGKGLYLIKNEKEFKSALRILQHYQKDAEDNKWIIEGWYDKKVDLNYQIYVSSEGNVTVFSIKEQLLNETVYTGSLIPPRISLDIINKINTCGEVIGKELYSLGFTGILGVDAFIDSQGMLIPIIEINARFTLSTYLSFLDEKFRNKVILTFYERIELHEDDSYEKISDEFGDIKINAIDGNGIFIYVAGTLRNNNEKHKGRLFVAAIADSYEMAFELKNRVKSRLIETKRLK